MYPLVFLLLPLSLYIFLSLSLYIFLSLSLTTLFLPLSNMSPSSSSPIPKMILSPKLSLISSFLSQLISSSVIIWTHAYHQVLLAFLLILEAIGLSSMIQLFSLTIYTYVLVNSVINSHIAICLSAIYEKANILIVQRMHASNTLKTVKAFK